MKILLIGYGKMGKSIEEVAVERGHEIVGRISAANVEELAGFNAENTDVAVEFTAPDSAPVNIRACIEKGIPVVCGTTGWLREKPEIDALCRKSGGAFLYASNFSIGVNIMFMLNALLAKVMDNYPEYDVSIKEVHHIHKADVPSGTAISLANGITQNLSRKKYWEVARSYNTDGSLKIFAERKDEVIGFHAVEYASDIDRITIEHEAFNRKGFAVGAVTAAEWLRGKQGVFSMMHVMGLSSDLIDSFAAKVRLS
jgi:4-hydroxy-tetrahydrodipicolinate reductase